MKNRTRKINLIVILLISIILVSPATAQEDTESSGNLITGLAIWDYFSPPAPGDGGGEDGSEGEPVEMDWVDGNTGQIGDSLEFSIESHERSEVDITVTGCGDVTEYGTIVDLLERNCEGEEEPSGRVKATDGDYSKTIFYDVEDTESTPENPELGINIQHKTSYNGERHVREGADTAKITLNTNVPVENMEQMYVETDPGEPYGSDYVASESVDKVSDKLNMEGDPYFKIDPCNLGTTAVDNQVTVELTLNSGETVRASANPLRSLTNYQNQYGSCPAEEDNVVRIDSTNKEQPEPDFNQLEISLNTTSGEENDYVDVDVLRKDEENDVEERVSNWGSLDNIYLQNSQKDTDNWEDHTGGSQCGFLRETSQDVKLSSCSKGDQIRIAASDNSISGKSDPITVGSNNGREDDEGNNDGDGNGGNEDGDENDDSNQEWELGEPNVEISDEEIDVSSFIKGDPENLNYRTYTEIVNSDGEQILTEETDIRGKLEGNANLLHSDSFTECGEFDVNIRLEFFDRTTTEWYTEKEKTTNFNTFDRDGCFENIFKNVEINFEHTESSTYEPEVYFSWKDFDKSSLVTSDLTLGEYSSDAPSGESEDNSRRYTSSDLGNIEPGLVDYRINLKTSEGFKYVKAGTKEVGGNLNDERCSIDLKNNQKGLEVEINNNEEDNPYMGVDLFGDKEGSSCSLRGTTGDITVEGSRTEEIGINELNFAGCSREKGEYRIVASAESRNNVCSASTAKYLDLGSDGSDNSENEEENTEKKVIGIESVEHRVNEDLGKDEFMVSMQTDDGSTFPNSGEVELWLQVINQNSDEFEEETHNLDLSSNEIGDYYIFGSDLSISGECFNVQAKIEDSSGDFEANGGTFSKNGVPSEDCENTDVINKPMGAQSADGDEVVGGGWNIINLAESINKAEIRNKCGDGSKAYYPNDGRLGDSEISEPGYLAPRKYFVWSENGCSLEFLTQSSEMESELRRGYQILETSQDVNLGESCGRVVTFSKDDQSRLDSQEFESGSGTIEPGAYMIFSEKDCSLS